METRTKSSFIKPLSSVNQLRPALVKPRVKTTKGANRLIAKHYRAENNTFYFKKSIKHV